MRIGRLDEVKFTCPRTGEMNTINKTRKAKKNDILPENLVFIKCG